MVCFLKDKFRFRSVRLTGLVFTAAVVLISSPGHAQSAQIMPSEGKEQGFPVTDPLVISKCGTCHMPDGKGNLSRISWIRTTPEGWEEAIKRMVRLNGLTLTPGDARHILRYLSDTHGLSPSEAAPVENYAEHRMTDEIFPPDPDVRLACGACHQLARPLSWHRATSDWKYLVDMHLAFFPSSAPIAFDGHDGDRPRNATEAPGKQKPVDVAIEYIEKATPLHSAAWSKWDAGMAPPKLAGRWLVKGEERGKGKFFGEMIVSPGAEPGEFATKTTLHFVEEPTRDLIADGESIVYTGFQWRGRSTAKNSGMAPGDMKSPREVMLVSEDQSSMKGRWFWGQYENFGLDVDMRRAGDGPAVLGTDVYSLKAGSSDDKVSIYGDHLPANANSASIDFGPGIKIVKVLSQSAGILTVSVDVAADAEPGMRAVSVGGSTVPDALAIYKKIDFIKVTPGEALAHLGSATHPKGYIQFEADAYADGPDGKPHTADDIDLGPVQANWKLEEFVSTYGDDDVKYVGSIDPQTGFFTPGSDGPSPTRTSIRNNYGDVYAVATVNAGDSGSELTGRSYLVVTVPKYLIFDQPEVGQ